MNVLLICKNAEAEAEAKKHFKLKNEETKCFFDLSGAMAWLMLEKNKPHFLVVDLEMADAFILRLMKMAPKASIIGMTSEASQEQ